MVTYIKKATFDEIVDYWTQERLEWYPEWLSVPSMIIRSTEGWVWKSVLFKNDSSIFHSICKVRMILERFQLNIKSAITVIKRVITIKYFWKKIWRKDRSDTKIKLQKKKDKPLKNCKTRAMQSYFQVRTDAQMSVKIRYPDARRYIEMHAYFAISTSMHKQRFSTETNGDVKRYIVCTLYGC